MTSIDNVSMQGQIIEKPGTGAIIGGIAAGAAVHGLTKAPINSVSLNIVDKIGKINNSLTKDEYCHVEKAITETLKTSGLETKGVNIIKATPNNSKEISEIMYREIDKGFLKHLPKESKEIIGKMFSSQVEAGKNAFYAFSSKKIVVPEKGLGLALFHEAGHAMNDNIGKFGKILKRCRPMTLLAIPIAIIALFKTKKAPGEKPKNGLDKTNTFIKNNAGKLTFAAFVPLLLEEGLASLRGNRYAKKFLNPELAQKVIRTNRLGFLSYLSMATLSSLGIFFGTKIKDSIASKKVIPVTEQPQNQNQMPV